MGWKGGGLGKGNTWNTKRPFLKKQSKRNLLLLGGSGISEPISAQAIVNREGFGMKSASGQFKQKIRQIIEEYAKSSNPYDLVFTSGFDNDQRKEMHM